ncbi:MAG: 30S ribosomal protein S2 [Patescibacteria group bacterium]|jgi:small subunit ribosomal protein S2
MKIPTVEEMLKAGMHFGHRTSKWHPKMEPFIFGSRKGVHIIDLRKTQAMLGVALEYLKKQAAEGKTILLVGTKMQVKNTLKKTAEEAGVPYVSSKWLGGFLTNFAIIRNLIRKFKDLSEKRAGGKLDKYTKKERLDFDRQIAKLETNVGGLVSLTKTPDIIFIWDIKKEKTAFTEAMKKKIPVVAVCDTNTNPDGVKYIIPANDDASRGIKLVMNLVKEAILEGKAEGQNKEK